MVPARLAELVDMRQRMLAVATRLFAAHGFDGTTLQDVADAVGVSKPAVIHHFASKEALRAAALDALLDHWKQTLPRLLLAATATDDRFDSLIGELLRFFSSEPDRARLVLRELLDRPYEMGRLMGGAVRPWLAAIAAYVERGQERGRHHADADPEAYVLHVLSFAIAAIASRDVLAGALDQGPRGESPEARYERELVRMTRASLFTPAERTRAARPARRKTRRRR